ncbi:MAG: hypothetical protein LW832_10865 [Parachlamydia sp.]|jgi:hypothetical protein|nr:hypothetical protein [Parachlamydia sp.]
MMLEKNTCVTQLSPFKKEGKPNLFFDEKQKIIIGQIAKIDFCFLFYLGGHWMKMRITPYSYLKLST